MIDKTTQLPKGHVVPDGYWVNINGTGRIKKTKHTCREIEMCGNIVYLIGYRIYYDKVYVRICISGLIARDRLTVLDMPLESKYNTSNTFKMVTYGAAMTEATNRYMWGYISSYFHTNKSNIEINENIGINEKTKFVGKFDELCEQVIDAIER